MLNWSELKCTHSTVLSKNGNPFVVVMFECGGAAAEGKVPDCVIQRSNGFSEDEVHMLEDYMWEHKQEIIEAAKSITNMKNWFS